MEGDVLAVHPSCVLLPWSTGITRADFLMTVFHKYAGLRAANTKLVMFGIHGIVPGKAYFRTSTSTNIEEKLQVDSGDRSSRPVLWQPSPS